MALIIRDEQLRALRSARAGELEGPLYRLLEREYPEDCSRLGEGGARALVRETIRSAARRGVWSEAAMVGLLRLYVVFGPGLERTPHRGWANEVLDHPKIPGEIKVNLVSQRLSALTQGRRVVLPGEER
jgi:hypothetical protein